MECTPIIPIVAMAIICLALGAVLIGCRNRLSIIRRVLIIVMLFMVNLRMVIPGNSPELKIKSSDVYVLFVIDDTISMLAEDYNGNEERLTAVKEDCAKIIDGLDGAKFSILTFHNTANIMSPYTDNMDHAKSVINAIYPLQSYYASGTTINVVKDLLVTTLKKTYDDKDKQTIVFFISDGEITSDEELESFSGAGQYILDGGVLGYGTAAGGVMYVQDEYSDTKDPVIDYSTGDLAVSCLDEDNLKQIASDLGVSYYNMNGGYGISDKISEMKLKYNISSQVDTEVTSEGEYTDDTPIYFIFVILLVGLLIWEFVALRRKA